MNRYFAVSLLALAAAAVSPAFADDITVETTPFQSTRTRAEVQADLAAFRQAGVNPWSQAYNPLEGFASRTSRAQVTGDYLQSRGVVEALTAEDSGSFFLGRRAPAAAARVLAGQPVNAQ
jgi:hypothetical protein